MKDDEAAVDSGGVDEDRPLPLHAPSVLERQLADDEAEPSSGERQSALRVRRTDSGVMEALRPWLDSMDRVIVPQVEASDGANSAVRLLASQAASGQLKAIVLKRVDDLDKLNGQIHADMLSAPETAFTRHLADQMRELDRQNRSLAALAATAHWAESELGLGALTNWRVAVEAKRTILELLKPVAEAFRPYYNDLETVSNVLEQLTSWVICQDNPARLLDETSGRPLALWRDQIAAGALAPTAAVIRISALAGRAQAGIVSASLLVAAAGDIALSEAAARQIDEGVLDPWERSRLVGARLLRTRLGEIEPSVPALLDGAWEELERGGSAALEKAAHCITEVLDRTLRAAAPDIEVRAWHTAEGRSPSEWEDQDRPPQSLRIKFLARRLGGARQLVEVELASVISLHKNVRSRLQAAKHASAGDLAQLRSLLLSAESLLTLLLMPEQ